MSYEVKNAFAKNRLRTLADQIREWVPSGTVPRIEDLAAATTGGLA